jgi:hypothetical protein
MSSVVTAAKARPNASCDASIVRAAIDRNSRLTFDQIISMGLRSGEYGGKYSTPAPAASINPIFVVVGDKPIRARRKSAQWCLSGVDQCWKQKQRPYKAADMDEAKAAYAHAGEVYQRILAE